MAYESYKLLHSSASSTRKKMLNAKKKQVEYLFHHAIDREDNCIIDGRLFVESPRLFDRKIKTNYFQSITCETINKQDRFNSGSLLKFDSDNWICTSGFIFHDLYCKGEFVRCNYILKWQNNNGLIIERPCFIQSAAQYNSGERGNQTIVLGTDQLMVVLPNDKDTVLLDPPKSFFIDKNTVSPTPYRITRNDTVPYSDWDEGCINLVVTQRPTSDKDKPDLMLCDYIKPIPEDSVKQSINETTDLSCNIVCRGNPVINIGGYSKTFSAKFSNASGDILSDIVPEWKVTTTDDVVNKYIHYSIIDGKLCINADYNENLLGSKIRIDLSDSNSLCSSYILVEFGGSI